MWRKLNSLLILMAQTSLGATYYVDSSAGSDSNDGATNTPWLTLDHARTNVAAGDTLLLKRGGLWREQMTVSQHRLTIGAYATGNAPCITGSDLLTPAAGYHWTNTSWANVWRLETNTIGNPAISMPGGIWIDGSAYVKGYYSGSWTWYHANTLVAGTWVYEDAETLGYPTVYLYSAADPNALTIEGSFRGFCFHTNSKTNLSFSDLEMKQAGLTNQTQSTLYSYASADVTVSNCVIHDQSGAIGCIYALRSPRFKLVDCSVSNSFDPDGNAYGTLIYFESSTAGNCNNAWVSNCVITGSYGRLADCIGFIGAWAVGGGSVGSFSNCTVTHCDISGPGQNGVYMRSGCQSNTISFNRIRNIKGWQVNGGIAVQLRDQACYNLVYNNIATNCYGPLMQSDGKNGGPNSTNAACTGNQFLNNTIDVSTGGNADSANGFHFFGTNALLVAENNIVVTKAQEMIMVSESSADQTHNGITLANNRYWKTTATGYEFSYRGTNFETFTAYTNQMALDGYPNETGSSYGDPGLVWGGSITNGSACIDAGMTQTLFSTDFAGTTRPVGAAWDIGAYEYGTNAVPVPRTANTDRLIIGTLRLSP